MKPIKIKYKITGPTLRDGIEVEGYAIDSKIPVRFCIRQVAEWDYVADHYDTGYRIGPSQPTFDIAVKQCEDVLRRGIADGRYQKALDAVARMKK